MTAEAALDERVTALERALDTVQSSITESRTEAAFAHMNALHATQALARAKRDVEFCRRELSAVLEVLHFSRPAESRRIDFAVQRLDRALESMQA